ncbi:hypothetical protein jhhlp_003171 [Lomentospora prolificans]|uniref:Ataxin-10 homolog n=1 Tax=Lomentospora prolificans TaxID=41688 RepID=A0A2N3NG59_9PEZI|nr:hypothetical protein jhhlp_003171 [Lomentospora prolificans]
MSAAESSSAQPATSAPTLSLAPSPSRGESIEEKCLLASLITIECHFTGRPVLGPKSTCQAITLLSKSLAKTQDEDVRTRKFGPNVEMWVYLRKIFQAAIPSLANRALGPLEGPDVAASYPQSANLIVKNFATIKEDVQILDILMQIARNVLVSDSRPVPQDLCAASRFDKMAYKTIVLCAYVTNNSKAPGSEDTTAESFEKVLEIHDLFKRLLVTTLQQTHNWVVGHSWNKNQLFLDVLFDETESEQAPDSGTLVKPRWTEPDTEVARVEVQNWLARNSTLDPSATTLLKDYTDHHINKPPGPLEPLSPLAWNWAPNGPVDPPTQEENATPVWDPNATTKWDQDRRYLRTSHEIDTWWTTVVGSNFEDVTTMQSVQAAKEELLTARKTLLESWAEEDTSSAKDPSSPISYGSRLHHDDDAMTSGILTEIPNILDPRQIEALYMIIKTCILDSHGDGLTPCGENLQKTRCKMFLALNSGRSLFKEMLVYVGIWVLDDTALVYQVMRDIVLALHHNSLIPTAWHRVSSYKSFVLSPAQSVLLRLVGDIFCSTTSHMEDVSQQEKNRLFKLIHFFFSFFRTSLVPEYLAVMHVQAQIREGKMQASEFRMDYWEMQRAKAALIQYLEFIEMVAEVPETRKLLIEWEAPYDLIAILTALEAAVPKLPLVDMSSGQPKAVRQPGSSIGSSSPREHQHHHGHHHHHSHHAHHYHHLHHDSRYFHDAHSDLDSDNESFDSTGPMDMSSQHSRDMCREQGSRESYREQGSKYAWAGTKAPILTILATLLQPPPGRSTPGNPDVQRQVLQYNGLSTLLNCVSYDGYQPLSRERVTLCLKWLVEGNKDAAEWFKELFKHTEAAGKAFAADLARETREAAADLQKQRRAALAMQAGGTAAGGSSTAQQNTPVTSVRVDGVQGQLPVRVKPNTKREEPRGVGIQGGGGLTQMEEDFMA